MSTKNVIQTALDDFAQALGGRKKSGSWYVTRPDAVVVLHLQKSNYGPQYYLNFGLWFLSVGPARDPKPTHCHLQARLENLVAERDRSYLASLLDLDEPYSEVQRHKALLEALRDWLTPFIAAGGTVANLATPTGQWLLAKSLLDSDGQGVRDQARAQVKGI